MKKFVFIGAVIGIFANVAAFADTLHDTLFWRSSYSETADNQVLISSEGVLGLGGVLIGTATTDSYLYLYNNQVWGPRMSTITSINCSSAVLSGLPSSFAPIKVSSGLMYTKTGTCNTSILWDVLMRNPNVKPFRVN